MITFLEIICALGIGIGAGTIAGPLIAAIAVIGLDPKAQKLHVSKLLPAAFVVSTIVAAAISIVFYATY